MNVLEEYVQLRESVGRPEKQAMEMSKSQGRQTQMKRTNMDTKGAGVGGWEDWD